MRTPVARTSPPDRRGPRLGPTVLLGVAVLVSAVGLVGVGNAAPASAATRTFTGIGVTANGSGYGLVASSGENYDFGAVVSRGNPSRFTGGIVATAVTADGKGYVEVSGAGQVYAYGTVKYWGNPTGFTGSITGISTTADGQGYVVVSSAGQDYAYGSVRSWGNPTGFTGSIVGVSVTADGQGYVNVSSAGQNYAYGSVRSWGNPTGFTGSIVGVSVTADGQGYVNVSSSGQNYAYGSVRSWGNPTGFTGSIVGVSTTADGQGYADLSSTGQVYAYGSVVYRGNGDPGSADAATYANEILANPNIVKTGRLVLTDLQDAAAGRPATAGAMLSATMLRLIAGFGHQHRVTINALESGGTGHCHNTPKPQCPRDPHYTGDAVDFGAVDGQADTGRNAPAITLINALKGQLPSGSGFGQKQCGATPPLPAGISTFNDSCNHLHVQLPLGTP